VGDRLDGKVAVVTGSSRGLGRAAAQRLAKLGASIVVNYQSNSEAAEAVVEHIRGKGGTAVAVQADISSPAEIEQLFDRAEKEFGGIDIVVANAGRHLVKPVADTLPEDFDTVFGLNARGTFFTLREAARRMRDGGRVIVLTAGSLAGSAMGGAVAAAGSKAAAAEFVRTLAVELGPRNITVNAIAPGPTATDNFHAMPPERQAAAASRSLFGRVGEPSDIAAVVGFLASDEGGWISGQTIRATGGG
jgi:3-oxoacyl-[acyl-carrier protein] reductase